MLGDLEIRIGCQQAEKTGAVVDVNSAAARTAHRKDGEQEENNGNSMHVNPSAVSTPTCQPTNQPTVKKKQQNKTKKPKTTTTTTTKPTKQQADRPTNQPKKERKNERKTKKNKTKQNKTKQNKERKKERERKKETANGDCSHLKWAHWVTSGRVETYSFCSILGCVLSLQEVTLHQSPPTYSCSLHRP